MAAAQRRSCACIAAAVVCVSLVAAPAVRADDLPVSQFGVLGGARQGVGQIGDIFGLGVMFGVRAGYQRSNTERKWSLGVNWSVMWGLFSAADPGISDSSLSVIEMSLGLRVRRLMGPDVPRFLVIGAGASVLRTNVPVPPDMKRNYLGPYASLGVEQYLLGKYLLGIEWQYGLLAGGPGSLTGLITFSFGSK